MSSEGVQGLLREEGRARKGSEGKKELRGVRAASDGRGCLNCALNKKVGGGGIWDGWVYMVEQRALLLFVRLPLFPFALLSLSVSTR